MMAAASKERDNKAIACWLMIGVIMIIIQILIGGVTRLTESGLSITEWKPITGALPPSSESDWIAEFEKYRNTDQFKYVHQNFKLADFKFIYFWEWFHRQWARLIGVVFLAGFFYFLIRKSFSKNTILPLVLLFILGALQSLIGWIMVASGLLPDRVNVGHIELTAHLVVAVLLLVYTLWFALGFLKSFQIKLFNSGVRRFLWLLCLLVFFQLIYGGLMAGLKAAQSAPTWPDINGYFVPPSINELKPGSRNLTDNLLTVQFIHRGLGYLILLTSVIFFFKTLSFKDHKLFLLLRLSLLFLIFAQVILGIATVLNSTDRIALVWYGVAHQFVAMLIIVCLTSLMFLVRNSRG